MGLPAPPFKISGLLGLAAACRGGQHAGGDGAQGVGGWLGDGDGLEGEVLRVG